MKMNVFEYTITAKQNDIAGCDDIELAKKIAFKVAKRKHCDVDVINAFTGEVVLSLVCFIHLTYNAEMEEVEKFYEVKERVW